jgi:hypothetical protein
MANLSVDEHVSLMSATSSMNTLLQLDDLWTDAAQTSGFIEQVKVLGGIAPP